MTPEEEQNIIEGVKELKQLFIRGEEEDPLHEVSSALAFQTTKQLRMSFNGDNEVDDRTLGLVITQVAGIAGAALQAAGTMNRVLPAEVLLIALAKASVDLLGLELMDDDR